MNKSLISFAIILGIFFVVVAVMYFMTPAYSLPGFFPGYDAKLTTHHYKHGIGSLLLGVACFIFAWFQSGKKSKTPLVKEEQNG